MFNADKVPVLISIGIHRNSEQSKQITRLSDHAKELAERMFPLIDRQEEYVQKEMEAAS